MSNQCYANWSQIRKDSLKKTFKNSTVIKRHAEDFLVQKVLKQKIEFKSLSYLDGSDLITKSKGPMIKMDKKNLDSQYVYSETEGNQLLLNTLKYFKNFDFPFDLDYLRYEDIYISFASKSYISKHDNADRLVFFDTASKYNIIDDDDFKKKCYNHLIDIRNQFAYLENVGTKLANSKKKTKLPVTYCFYTRKDLVMFSLFNCVLWFNSKKAIISN